MGKSLQQPLPEELEVVKTITSSGVSKYGEFVRITDSDLHAMKTSHHFVNDMDNNKDIDVSISRQVARQSALKDVLHLIEEVKHSEAFWYGSSNHLFTGLDTVRTRIEGLLEDAK